MMNIFRSDYGVFCCKHVFKEERPILLVVRDTDGTWQFLCGQQDESFDDPPHHVGVGHLLSRDQTLQEMADLKVASGARRTKLGSEWEYFDLE